jgi:Leucine-rich repeat (LRR) protein
VKELKGLRHLNVGENRLSSLSEKGLEFLDLRVNRLTAVPEEVRSRPRLRKLDLRWNKVRPLPDWVARLERNGCTVYW